MWDGCGRQLPKPRIDRQQSCPEQLGAAGACDASYRRLDPKNSGKRFARRAKRWAELQQRRQNARTSLKFELADELPLQPHFYDVVELCQLTTGVLPYAADTLAEPSRNPHHASLRAHRSLSYSLLQPQHREIPVLFPSDHTQSFVAAQSTINDYGQQTRVSVLHTTPEIIVYPRLSHPKYSRPAPDARDFTSMNLLASELSNVNLLSDGDSLSTSVSSRNSESDDQAQFSLSARGASKPILGERLSFRMPPPPLPSFSWENDLPKVNTVPPPDRSWMMIRHADLDRPIATFTVLCYNVLCDKYATAQAYSYCPSWALNWEYRKNSIMKEIRNYEADIITLQEVETEQFKLLFNPELKQLGYSSVFSPKSRAKTMNDEEKKYVDGCAIFWKAEKFELEKEQLIEFTQVAIQKAKSSEHMLNRVMPRDNIALCAVLRVKESVYNNRRVSMTPGESVVGCPLVVCTAHIHWDPEFCDVKLVQTLMLTSELNRLLQEVSDRFRMQQSQIPVLICGDLNSLPDSGVFEFLSKGHVARQHPDFKQFKDDSILDKFSVSNDPSQVGHTLRLDSSVDTSSVPFTNYTLDFKGVIDYIFSTPQSLARLGVLGPFDMQWVQHNKIIGFPHPHVPSDHIPIMAQYAIIPTSHQQQHHNSKAANNNHQPLGLNSLYSGPQSFGQLNFGR